MIQGYRLAFVSVALLLGVVSSAPRRLSAQAQPSTAVPRAQSGQTSTQLPDGRWLLVGGEHEPAQAAIWDPTTEASQRLTGPHTPRAWHTATVMPDGSVLVVGGVDEQGRLIDVPERFDATSGRFSAIESAVMTARARHTATLLTDGRVLLAGGDTRDGAVAELWHPELAGAFPTAGVVPHRRRGHAAELLSDGRVVLSGGTDDGGRASDATEIFDPATDLFVTAKSRPANDDRPRFVASMPADGAVDVKLDARIALRFATRLDRSSIQSAVVTLDVSGAARATSLVATESGRLIFITPAQPLPNDAAVALNMSGLRDAAGRDLPPVRVTFTTESSPRQDPPGAKDPDVWTPASPDNSQQALQSPWRKLPPLAAPKGVTALAGQALLLDGRPLADVTLEIDGHAARTDRTGRFLLHLGALPGGWHELVIDGASANRGQRRFGIFEYGLSIVATRTNILPFTIWMPVLDTANTVRIQSPTRQETVVTTPHIAGLELHLPAGTVITDEDGKIVREVSITPIPVDRPPFPLPNGVEVPIYFTIQPGGAYVEVAQPASDARRRGDTATHASAAAYGSYSSGAYLVYPNYTRQPVNQRLPFWHYDPEHNGWHVYGHGRVTADGQQVRPYRGVVLYEFTGAMIGIDRDPPGGRLPPGGIPAVDPVDLASGTFVMDKVDLVLPDVMPLVLTRTYRANDDAVRPFGVGGQHPYDMWFDNQGAWFESDLILPDGSRIHYTPILTGPGGKDVILEHTATPTRFYGSRVTPTTTGWDLTLTDGTTYVFGYEAPLQKIRDRFGNTITISRTGGLNGNIAKITSPHGRYIAFTYDTSDRITQATDNLGRTVTYTYDTAGRLATVTDARGGVTEYTYDGAHRMLTIKDPRNIVYLENEYDTAGRVIRQTQADAGEYELDYTLNGSGDVTQTEVTNPRGFVRRVAFNSAGYMTSDTVALGETVEQTTTYTRASGSHLVETVTDELGRVTRFQYDAKGNPTSVARLYGTADEQVTTLTYDATYNQMASVTDPLSRTTSYTYGPQGRLSTVTDPLNHQTSFVWNAAGQPVATTTALNKTTTFTYDVGDLVQVTTPSGHSQTQFVDTAGRVLQMTDALGGVTRLTYNNHDQLLSSTDPGGGQTTFTYDANGNLLALTDARNKTTTWTYDSMDRVASRTDPLTRAESFTYDLNGNLSSWTDRKGQVTTYGYDALDRRTFVGFGTTGTPPTYASTITTTYDAGNRVTEVVDSVGGTIEHTFDALDRLIEEITPEGTVTYTYDEADRPATMTVAGQTAVSYTFDDADRMTGVTRGTAAVTVAHDASDRRTSLTLPNGIVVEYGYDDDSQLTSLTYKQGGTTLGGLAYTYDPNGQRTAVSGTYARSGLPAALTSATYDDANQLATFGGTSFTYDSNGNLTADGSKSYSWNARDELTGISGAVSATFTYDGFGRRRSKTTGGTTTQFLYDGLTSVQELASGAPTANLLTGMGIDEYFTRTDGSGTANYLTDALGSSVALADSTGTVVAEYTYDPFGGTSVSGSTSGNAFGFTGRENDGTGLHYYRARYYDPRLQRFIGEDPFGFGAGDVNLHAYVFNDPVSLTDPTGEFAMMRPSACRKPTPTGRKSEVPRLRRVLTWMFGDPCDPLNMMPTIGPLSAPGGPLAGPLRRLLRRLPYVPKTPLPRDPRTGNPIPLSDLPHTRLGTQPGKHSGGPYPAAREFGPGGKHVRDIHWTDHGRPGHQNPHQHVIDPVTGARGPAIPFDWQ